ncbi:hypothetical protein [uncultured Prevotella sp.]|uniref:hypothetical protein n=1 Tax=uncultured Prevotella sp. TaxID=159272 RepID=UPI002590D470|nr:hypothetical protein [uncultured Prevotella sp.]
MRKFLLFACAAVVSLSASAQVLQTPLCKTVLNNNVKFDNMTSVKAIKNVQSNAKKAAPARIAHDGIYGLYILAYTELDEKWSCDSVIVEKVNVTDEESNATYNTKFTFCSENAPTSFYGQYDAAAGTITCPVQRSGSFSGNTTQGPVDYKFKVGVLLPSGDQYAFSEEPFVFTVDEDGTLLLDVEDGGALANIIEGKTTLWNFFFSLELKPANAVISYSRPGRQEGTYDDFVHAAYVEDYGNNVSVYGYGWFQPSSGMGLSTVTPLDIDKDLNVLFTGPQNAFLVAPFGIQDEAAGKYFKICGTKPAAQQGYVEVDTGTPSYVNGKLSGNKIIMDSFPVFSNFFNDPATGEQMAYGFWYLNYVITLDEGVFQADKNSTGINGVTETSVKNVKTYNLFGQEVPATTKGLVIRDGKKFFNK